MIRIRHVTLPSGLSAFVRRGATGDLEVFVSESLDPARARAAVRLALRSFRSSGARTGLLPLPVALLLAGGMARIRSAVRATRAHAVRSAAAGAATAVAAALVVLVAVPHQHGPATAGQGSIPPSQIHASAPTHSPGLTKPGHGRGTQPSARASRPSAGQSAVPTSERSTSPAAPQPSSHPSTGPAPHPSGSGSSAPAPTPTPTPSPSPSDTGGGSGGGGVCVVVLGVRVCL